MEGNGALYRGIELEDRMTDSLSPSVCLSSSERCLTNQCDVSMRSLVRFGPQAAFVVSVLSLRGSAFVVSVLSL